MPENPLDIHPIPAFNDNYIWLIRGTDNRCTVVDPGDSAPVLDYLAAHGLILDTILITHHHWDHAGGVDAILEVFPAKVYGPDDERLGPWCEPCREGDEITIESIGVTFKVLDIPAHTRTHIAFHGHGVLFSGDTLFSMGCGRLFEGSPQDMQVAMDKLAELSPQTRVYCGHEYTRSNCAFALQVDPENTALQARAAKVEALRATGEVTLPSLLADELAANPFMRTRCPEVVAAARTRDPEASPGASVMAVIRAWKDAA